MQMKILKSAISLLLFWTQAQAQDGSDIRYFKPLSIDSSIVGQFVHFDFYRKSFQIHFSKFAGEARAIDTVIINMDNIPLKFIEHRVDDGFNNWFSEQYLQSIDKIDGQTIRIPKLKLDSITATSFQVTMFVNYYDANNKFLIDKSRQVDYWFDKKNIIEVLVKSKQR